MGYVNLRKHLAAGPKRRVRSQVSLVQRGERKAEDLPEQNYLEHLQLPEKRVPVEALH